MHRLLFQKPHSTPQPSVAPVKGSKALCCLPHSLHTHDAHDIHAVKMPIHIKNDNKIQYSVDSWDVARGKRVCLADARPGVPFSSRQKNRMQTNWVDTDSMVMSTLYGKTIFNCLKNLHTVFQWLCHVTHQKTNSA